MRKKGEYYFCRPKGLVRSETNHNHEELVESIEVYRYEGFKQM